MDITDTSKSLASYLNDHWAGSALGERLADRLATKNLDTDGGKEFVKIAREIREERAILQAIRSELGIEGGDVKRTASIALALATQLKTSVGGYGALGRLFEIEALLAGVSSKRGLWVALRNYSERHPGLARFDLMGLEKQAARQAKALRQLQQRAAAEAFGAESDQPQS